jgi:hypothetical protein
VLGELPLGLCSNRRGSNPALHFSLLGSKLYVSSSQVMRNPCSIFPPVTFDSVDFT